mgnify:CR=1 FL=1
MSSFTMPVPTRDEVRRGILYMIAAVFVFSLVNAAVKLSVAELPISEVIFFRCLFAMLPCSLLVMTHGGLRSLRTRRFSWHLTRAIVQFASMSSIFMASKLMPLADAVALSFSAPLFMTLFSIPILGERVGPYRWTAVLVGFAGVLVMAHPGAGTLSIGALFAISNAVGSACVTIGVRRMSVTESSATLVFYQTSITALFSLVLLPFSWVTPDWHEVALLAVVGLGSGVAQYLWAQAFRFAPAAVAAPFNYTSMIWAMGLGFLLWGDLPTSDLAVGALIVAASGLFIAYLETRRRAEAAVPALKLAAAAGD